MRKLIILFLFVLFSLHVRAQLPALGGWRLHQPWGRASAVAEGTDRLFCATEGGLIVYYPTNNELTTLTKVNGLSDNNLIYVAYSPETNAAVLGYDNGNVDVLDAEGNIVNVNAIAQFNFSGNKAIQHIYCHGTSAYLCTGIGISRLDIPSKEIQETYLIGTRGGNLAVNSFAASADRFFAATDSGLFWAWQNSPNLLDYQQWSRVEAFGRKALNSAAVIGDTVYVVKQGMPQQQRLYRLAANLSGVLDSTLGEANQPLRRLEERQGKLVYVNEYRSIAFVPATGQYIQTPANAEYTRPAQALIDKKGDMWTADAQHGLLNYRDFGVFRYTPNSPTNKLPFKLTQRGTRVYFATGGYTSSFSPLYRKEGFSWFDGVDWTNVPYTSIDSVRDVTNVLEGPDGTVWIATYDKGLYSLTTDGSLTHYTPKNSKLQYNTGLKDSVTIQITDMAFDFNGNLWLLNSWAPLPLVKRSRDGTWSSYSLTGVTEYRKIVADSRGYLWIVPRFGGLAVLNEQQQLHVLAPGVGNGNLPNDDVLSMAEDKDGSMWIGTAEGIGVIYNPVDLFGPTPAIADAVKPVLSYDGFAAYLFKSEQVQAICVDGGNRKWVGTGSGAFLISSDGTAQLAHFTADNSPLQNNNVYDIVLTPANGEVFFVNDGGLASYRGVATNGLEKNNIQVFPNPVRENFVGDVAIAGLVNNAYVKITDLSGLLVYQTRALGGQASWNGRDPQGKKAAPGMYLVWASDEEGNETAVAKIAVLR